MRLIQRINAILNANLNDLLERFEDPRKMLEHAVREMEDTIRSARENAASVLASEKLLSRQITQHEAAAEKWQDQARAAVQSEDEAAAKNALRRRREQQALAVALRDQRDEADAVGQRLRRQIEAMQARLNEARRRLTTLVVRNQAADARRRFAVDFGDTSDASQSFSLFERFSDKVDRLEAEADALFELSVGEEPGDSFDVETDSEIDRELAALQAEAGSSH
ncbi:MAG: phage shock protein A [Porticoccaceae bacterium]|jgi:phage shock protein A